jgi:hypothetical protein
MLRAVFAAAIFLAAVFLAGCGDVPSTDANRGIPSGPDMPALDDSSRNPSLGDEGGESQSPTEPVVNATPPEPGDDTVDFAGRDGAPPPLNPELITLARIGGAGDQWIRDVYFESDGRIVGVSENFTVTFDANGRNGVVTGDTDATMEGNVQRPSLPGSPGRFYSHAATGLDFAVGYRQAGGNLQTPIFRAFQGEDVQWRLWGHAVADIEAASLGADSRCYQAWGMPNGAIGVQCWCDGGNTVLDRDPRDLSEGAGWKDGAWSRTVGGMSTMYALIDPRGGGSVLSGTFVASHVTHLAVDGWGRVYLARGVGNRQTGEDPTDVFGVGADSASPGLAILSPDLRQVVFNAGLSGQCEGGQGAESIVLQDNLLVIGGATCADGSLEQRNPVQPEPGGGRDGFIAVIRLW